MRRGKNLSVFRGTYCLKIRCSRFVRNVDKLIQQGTRRHIQADNNFHNHRRQYLKLWSSYKTQTEPSWLVTSKSCGVQQKRLKSPNVG